jgi:putative inorganic carbon (HCO3(-)) transporter
MPEVRRIVDWSTGFSSISIISVIPLLALIPLAVLFIYSGAVTRLPRALKVSSWLWLGAFGPALVVGIGMGNGSAALYEFLTFALPPSLGSWLATQDLRTGDVYERIAGFLLWLSIPICIYGAWQFAAPPPWDADWMRHVNMSSIGQPLPYQLRPFSTLNSPGPFADFLTAAIIFNLPRLRATRPLDLVAFALCIATLVLTMVRSNWIALIVAVLCYLSLTPMRGRNLMVMAAACGLCAAVVVNASVLLGSDAAGTDIGKRFSTFTDIGRDQSLRDRYQLLLGSLQTGLDQPTGGGLGMLGTAAKLGDAGQTIVFDNGYLARFIELGYFGFACYLATLAAGVLFAYRRWGELRRAGSPYASVAAAGIALQLALAWLDVSSDHHNGLLGIFFWLSLAFLSGRGIGERERASPSSSAQQPSRRWLALPANE